MTWTYDNTLSSDEDKVRFFIGDTIESDQQLSDEEITFLLASYGGAIDAAIAACRTLAAKYARQVDRSVGDMSLSASHRMQHYRDLADDLGVQQFLISSAAPWAGSVHRSEKDNISADTDLVQPAFTRNLHIDV